MPRRHGSRPERRVRTVVPSASRAAHPPRRAALRRNGAQPVPNPAPALAGRLRNVAVGEHSDRAAVAVRLDPKLHGCHGRIQPRSEEDGVGSPGSCHLWRDLAGQQSQPLLHVVDDCLVHDPGRRGVLPPPADNNKGRGSRPRAIAFHAVTLGPNHPLVRKRDRPGGLPLAVPFRRGIFAG
jgi:hypothetical protein